MFTVAIIGTDGISDTKFIEEKCINCLKEKAKTQKLMINHVNEDFPKLFCKKYRINSTCFNVDWKTNGNDAIKKRNEELIESSDALIIFNNNKKDTEILLNMFLKSKKPVRKYLFNNDI